MSYNISFRAETTGAESVESLRAKVLLMQQQYQTSAAEVRKSVQSIAEAQSAAAKASMEGDTRLAASRQAAASAERAALDGLIAKQGEVKAQLDALTGSTQKFTASTMEARAAVQAINGNFGTMAAGRWLAQMEGIGPLLHGIFMVAGPLAFIDVVVNAVKKVGELSDKWSLVAQSEKNAKDAAEEYGKSVDSIKAKLRSLDDKDYTHTYGKTAGLAHEATELDSDAQTKDRFAGLQKGQLARAQKELAAAQAMPADSPARLGYAGTTARADAIRAAQADIKAFTAQMSQTMNEATVSQAQAADKFGDLRDAMAADKARADKPGDEEAKRKAEQAKELQNRVNEYAKGSANYDLGPVSLAIQKRDEMLATPGLTGSEKATINEAGAQEIARALAKIADEESRLKPLQHKSNLDKTLSAGGTGIEQENSEAARTILRDMTKALNELHENIRRVDSANFSGMRDNTNRQVRLAGIGAKPDDEVAIAKQALDLRLNEIAQEREAIELHKAAYNMDAEDARLRGASNDATLDYLEKLAQYTARQREAFEKEAGSLFDALASRRPGAITDLLRQEILSIGKSITQDLAGKLYKSLPAGPLKSGIDVLTGAKDPLKVATEDNTGATRDNTTALKDLKGGNSVSGGAGVSGAAGGSSSPAGVFGANPLTGLIPQLPAPYQASADSALGGNPLAGIVSSLPGTPAPAGGFGLNTKTIADVAVVAAGAISAVQGFSRGGASGALQGVGGLLGAASVIPGPQQPFVAGAAMVTSLLGGWLNSPQRRLNDINNELGQNQYIAPQALNVTQSSGGRFLDFDAKGNLRTSNFSPYPTVSQGFTWEQTHGLFDGPPTYYNVPGGQTGQFGAPVAPVVQHIYQPGAIQAMDSQSFADFAEKNNFAIGNATALALQQSHARLSTEVQRTANP